MPGHTKKKKKTSMKVGGNRGATSGGNAAERGARRNGTRGATSGGNAAERGSMKKKYGTRRR